MNNWAKLRDTIITIIKLAKVWMTLFVILRCPYICYLILSSGQPMGFCCCCCYWWWYLSLFHKGGNWGIWSIMILPKVLNPQMADSVKIKFSEIKSHPLILPSSFCLQQSSLFCCFSDPHQPLFGSRGSSIWPVIRRSIKITSQCCIIPLTTSHHLGILSSHIIPRRVSMGQ